MPPSGYAPGGISQRRADAQRRWTALEREIPAEMWEVFLQLVGEETGLLEGRPQSLARFGHQHGWNQIGKLSQPVACSPLAPPWLW